jgi:hypothetical protein
MRFHTSGDRARPWIGSFPSRTSWFRWPGGEIVLRSASLKRRIVPRLTTAHNFRSGTLGLYRFLCAVQGQGWPVLAGTGGPSGTRPSCRG